MFLYSRIKFTLNIEKDGKEYILQDFKAFAMKGNVIDMAVGVVIGGAFGKSYHHWLLMLLCLRLVYWLAV